MDFGALLGLMIDASSLVEKWQEKGKVIAFSALIFLSMASIHYVTFVFSIPEEFRAFLDVSFKADFAASFFIVVTFSIIVARYLPQSILAVGVLFISEGINLKYYRRGYRRIATIWGIYEHRHSSESRKKYKSKLHRFGRNDARFDNLIQLSVQKRLPILYYEEHKLVIIALLAIFIGLWLYIGFTKASWLFAMAVLIKISLDTYFAYNDRFKFHLRNRFSGDDPDYEPKPFTLDSQDLFVAAITIAIVVGIAGPLRLHHITREANVGLVYEERTIGVALVGSTAHGLLFFDQEYGFIPFSAITKVRKFADGE